MEYEIKTIVCPNCGANTTNHQNCEYCGSMLVRCYEMMGIDEDSDEEDEKEVIKLFGKSAYTNEYLSERVKKIIDLSAKYETEIRGDIYSYVGYDEPYENISTVVSDNQRDTLTLIIKFNMQSAWQNRHFGYFEDKSFSKLLTIRQENSIMLCSMEIDKNEKTAAKFIKYIVEEFFSWKYNKYECRIFGAVNGESKEFVPKYLLDSLKKVEQDKVKAEQDKAKAELDREKVSQDRKNRRTRNKLMPFMAIIACISGIMLLFDEQIIAYILLALWLIGNFIILSVYKDNLNKSLNNCESSYNNYKSSYNNYENSYNNYKSSTTLIEYESSDGLLSEE